MRQEQPKKLIGETYDLRAMLRELEALHKRLNDLAISPAQANLKTDYVAADVDSAAELAEAFNATNAAVNQVLAKLNLS